MWRLGRLLASLGFLLVASVGAAGAEPNYPDFTAPVVDAAHVLSDSDRTAITRKLFDLQLATGVQFAVATVPSLDGLEIEPYANGLFRKWKIGQKGVNNGLLLLLAPTERKTRFEVGYGLEGSFTDLQSKLILHNTMVQKLKAGDAAGALQAGVDDAILVLTKDKASLPDRLKQAPAEEGPSLSFMIFAGIFIILFFYLMSRRGIGGWGFPLGWGAGSSMGSSFGNDSSSSGDSFSGGGGGDSGGGGSSDSY